MDDQFLQLKELPVSQLSLELLELFQRQSQLGELSLLPEQLQQRCFSVQLAHLQSR
jgi:hypothetical protein